MSRFAKRAESSRARGELSCPEAPTFRYTCWSCSQPAILSVVLNPDTVGRWPNATRNSQLETKHSLNAVLQPRSTMLKAQAALLLVLASIQLCDPAVACPFCSAVSQSLAEEMESMDVVAVAKFTSRTRISTSSSLKHQEEVPLSNFEFTHVLKGEEHIQVGTTFQTLYLGTPTKQGRFLAMAVGSPKLAWSTPLELTDRAEKYLRELPRLPTGAARLEFFQDYLEDQEEMLARDAYNEFARAPYSELVALKQKIDRHQLIEFIDDPDVSSLRRKLYFTMLGVCGVKEDAKLLERLMASEDGKSGLDAMLACYLNLTGAKGLDRIDELFLANRDADYVDINAAVVALRFHGNELEIVPRKRLLESLKLVLEIPSLADLVIADLARWEDWDAIPKLCELFINANEDSSFVRVPVINYLRACPLPIAKEKIEELKHIDADAVKYATTEPSLRNSELASQPLPLSIADEATPSSERPGTVAIADPTAHKSMANKKQFRSPWLVGGPICLGMIVLIFVLRYRKAMLT